MGKISGEIGRKGEEIAAKYLEEKGYIIWKKNYKLTLGEIDIIAEDAEDVLVFVEVKTYKENSLTHPLESITAKKQHHMRNTALCYLARHNLDDIQVRFDLIIVRNNTVADHLENIF
jgi:putative endonuclease